MPREMDRLETLSFQGLDADEFRDSVRELLVLMGTLERKLVMKVLEDEMMQEASKIRSYLSPENVPTPADDLAPSKVGP